MTLQEYLNQADPQRMPRVIVQKSEYRVTNTRTYMKDTVSEEIRKQVFFNTDNPLLAGVEYCLIGTHFYTVDRDGNPKKISCFSIPLNDSVYCK